MSGSKFLLLGAAAAAMVAAPARAEPSNYVKCDGQARDVGTAETLGRLAVVIGTMGLFGVPEADNVRERLFGEAGVTACNAALSEGQGKSDDVRRSRLMLARAVHHIEAKKLDAALADVRAFPGAGGARADEPGFRRSLGVSALDLEAATLLRMGKAAEAEAVALRMAEQSPLDLVTQVRAALYLETNPGLTDEKRAFYVRLMRLFPEASFNYATAQEWAGDYRGAAGSIETLTALVEEKDVSPSVLARLAALHILAGDGAKGAALIDRARKANEDMAAGVAGGAGADATRRQESVSRTDELLEFARVAQLMADGKIAEARTVFSARPRWLAPSVPLVAAMTEKLRAGAGDPAGLTGALARDPATLRSDAIEARIKGFTDEAADKGLYGSIRAYLSEGQFSGLSRDVWNTAKSPYLQKKSDSRPGETLIVRRGYGVAAGDALLLHAALLAQARGKSGFAFLPGRFSPASARVLIDNPGANGIPEAQFFNAAEVIAELSPRLPKPRRSADP